MPEETGSEFVWLVRAATPAYLNDAAQRKLLEAHYEESDGSLEYRLGRLMLGLESEEEIIKIPTKTGLTNNHQFQWAYNFLNQWKMEELSLRQLGKQQYGSFAQ